MKRKYADRSDWHRVTKQDFICRHIDDGEFKGYVTLIAIHQVKEPLMIRRDGQFICLADAGYYWMQHFPEGANYCVTTMFNKKKEVVQWYVDISKHIGTDERGIPFWDDLYLDIVAFPDGSFYIKDEDELEHALGSRHIEEADYLLAKKAASKLVDEIEKSENPVIMNSLRYLEWLIKERTMSSEYTVIRRTPTLAEYIELTSAVGWRDFMNYNVAEASLQQSIFGVVVQHEGAAIGMGRVVGDGSIYFYIQDIAVVPQHQGKGIGQMIMAEITAYLKEHAPEKAFIGLFAAQGKESFYNKYGFNKHDGMTGMFGVMHEGEIK